MRTLTLLFALAATAAAQQSTAAQRPAAGPQDTLDAQHGLTAYTANCGTCHGEAANGGIGPSLVASSLIRRDDQGDQLAKILHEGRIEKGMPAFPSLPADQVAAISTYLHARIASYSRRSALSGGSIDTGHLLTGSSVADGKQFFDARCATCHAGNLAGVAKKYTALELMGAMLAPKDGPETGTVTLRSGTAYQGRFLQRDDYSAILQDAAGNNHSFPSLQGVTITVDAPLRAHRELLNSYTQKEVHDVFAYLETLR